MAGVHSVTERFADRLNPQKVMETLHATFRINPLGWQNRAQQLDAAITSGQVGEAALLQRLFPSPRVSKIIENRQGGKQ